MNKKYFFLMLMLALIAPALCGMVFYLEPVFDRLLNIWRIPNRYLAAIYALVPALFLMLCGLCVDKPRDFGARTLPLFVAFAFYALMWIGIGTYAEYDIERYSVTRFIRYLALSYYPLVTRLDGADLLLFPLYPAAGLGLGAILLALIPERARFEKLRPIVAMTTVSVLMAGVCGYQMYELRRNAPLAEDLNAARVSASVDLWDYQMYQPSSLLQKPDAPPSVSFDDNLPILDGATALYPMYAATAQALYRDPSLVNEPASHVRCNKTDGAYKQLADGECDVIFCAEPSKEQLAYAKENGKEFTLTPISKEAFVFFVNQDNPVDGLTTAQIQDIYQGKITNWNQLGGSDMRILPFQRNENSGSQTAMLHHVMKDKPIAKPLKEEVSYDMGGAITQVAEYRDYPSAIGYSFRFYTQVMKSDARTKLLRVDGVAPTVENIRSGAYPFTIAEYAITAGSDNPNVQPMIDWMLSPEGQSFIEKTGRVGIH